MTITPEKVQAFAGLVKITLASDSSSPNSATQLAEKLTKEIKYMLPITQVDLKGVSPLYAPTEHLCSLRSDIVQKHLTTSNLLQNAPEKEDGYFVVPSVL